MVHLVRQIQKLIPSFQIFVVLTQLGNIIRDTDKGAHKLSDRTLIKEEAAYLKRAYECLCSCDDKYRRPQHCILQH